MKIAGTLNWTDYLDDQKYVLTENQDKIKDLELYGIYIAQDSLVTFEVEAPSPGEKYSWFVSKTCGAIFEYDTDWNPEIIETVFYEPIEIIEEEEPKKKDKDKKSKKEAP